MSARPRFDRMTDLEVLELLRDGKYVVDPEAGSVSTAKGHKLKTFLDDDSHHFVALFKGGQRRGIALHRLVWMSVTWTIPPPGYEVHHRDEDPDNNTWSNLFLLHQLDHRKLHGADLLAKTRGDAWEGEELPF